MTASWWMMTTSSPNELLLGNCKKSPGDPAECREDLEFGTVETRVWGLEALKHARLTDEACKAA